MKNIYFFTATWCVSCKRLKPHVDKFFEDVIFIDIDNNPGLVERFDIRSVPQLIVENVDEESGVHIAERLINPTPPQVAQIIQRYKD